MGFRYIGSKDKLSQIIISEINSLDFDVRHVIDLMAGTGLFSLALRENNFRVTAVDVMTYSYHHLNVFLFLDHAPEFGKFDFSSNETVSPTLFQKDAYGMVLDYLNSLTPVEGYFFQEFSPEGSPTNTDRPRKYFTSHNARKIDAIRSEIKNLRRNGLISEIEHSLLIHDLIMAVNDIANIAGTYGHYLSEFIKRSNDPIELYPTVFSKKGSVRNHKIYRAYAEDIASTLAGDLCYIDPPYIKRQYAANYHVLETLAREDDPEAIGESGLRPWRDQYSDFCSKLKIRDSFAKILTNIKCDYFLISYSEDGLLEIDDLISFLSGYGRVEKREIKYKRFKSNDSKKDASLTEFLIYLKKT